MDFLTTLAIHEDASMEPPNRIKELRDVAGMSQAALGKAARTSGEQIRKLESGERRLTLDWMVRLSTALGCEVKDLLGETPKKEVVAPVATTQPSPQRLPESLHVENPADLIPVRSAGRGGNGQEMFLSDGPLGWTRRPTVLETVRDAYAVYMVGDSMEPRYFSSYLLYVHPHKPARVGRAVVVTLNSNEVLVKLYVSQDPYILRLRQLNPEKDIKIDMKDIREIHLVVGSAEE